MSALTNHAEKALLDWMSGAANPTRPSALYLALFTTATSEAGGGTELSGNGYAREAVTFSAATTPDGNTSNSAEVTFTASGGNWGSITHAALMDAATGGNMWFQGPLSSSRTINDGDTLSFAAGAVDLTLA